MSAEVGRARHAGSPPRRRGWWCWVTGWRALGCAWSGCQSTGVDWKPVCYLLEDAVACWLLERSAPSQRAGSQDRRRRRGVDRPTRRARAGAPLVRAAKPIRQLRELNPLPQGADPPSAPAEAQRLHKRLQGRWDQARLRGLGHAGSLGSVDAGSADQRHDRPEDPGRARQGAAAGKAPRAR